MVLDFKEEKTIVKRNQATTKSVADVAKNIVYDTRNLNLWYGDHHGLKDVNLSIYENEVTAIIGPSGCGKSTYLKTLNRMVELVPIVRTSGEILYRERNILDKNYTVEELRTRVGMVFQKPNPFPKSIFDNVAYGPKLHGLARDKYDLEEIVENSLRKAGLWEEVKDRLNQPGTGLSGGQQQRLCIARTIAVSPEVILMDEPCSALDPVSTLKIEELISHLKEKYTIVIVTHNMQQAQRIADKTVFMYLGEVKEEGYTSQIFGNPLNEVTANYITFNCLHR